MKLEEMKKIRAERSPGTFNEWHFTTLRQIPVEQQQRNNQFLRMVVDNWDKLIAVVEAAKAVRHADFDSDDTDRLDYALKALEQEEGE